MKILVTADTHMPSKARELPSCLMNECESADLLIHAGDWKSMEVYRNFFYYVEVTGVYGNVDSDDIKELLPKKEIVEVNGHKIGVVHGDGEKKTTEKRAIEAFEGENVDVVIFGHSHIPLLRYFKNRLLMNPGSPTDKRKLPYYSYGILHMEETVRAEIVFFSDNT